MLEQGYVTRPIYEESIAQPLPSGRRDPGARGRARRRRRRGLLHELGPAAGDRTLRRPTGLRRRAEGQDHPGPRTPARRRRGRQLLLRRRRSHRLAGGDRKLDRRGARDGRGAQLRPLSLQPRHRRRAPARLGLQGLRPRRRPRARHLPLLGLELQAEDVRRPHPQRPRTRSSSTTTKAPTRARTPSSAPRPSPTTRSTPKWASTSAPTRSPSWPTRWASPPPSRRTPP